MCRTSLRNSNISKGVRRFSSKIVWINWLFLSLQMVLISAGMFLTSPLDGTELLGTICTRCWTRHCRRSGDLPRVPHCFVNFHFEYWHAWIDLQIVVFQTLGLSQVVCKVFYSLQWKVASGREESIKTWKWSSKYGAQIVVWRNLKNWKMEEKNCNVMWQ